MMETGFAQLRAKTDRDLAILIRREAQRVMALSARGRYMEAARKSQQARQWLAVANLPAQDVARLERLLDVPALACA